MNRLMAILLPPLVLTGATLLWTGAFDAGEAEVRAELVPAPRKEAPPDPAAVRADESGLFAVLEYHRVGGDPSFAPEWTISPEDLWAQLEYLYRNDYHPINFRDLLKNNVEVPAGKTPVVLTFDDSSQTQFTMVRDEAGRWVPGPDGAVGVLAAFHREHPDWPMRVTWFVLPAAAEPNNLFGQPELTEKKLEFLVDAGMEIGSHTFWHANLEQSSPQEVQEQIVRMNRAIRQYIPGYSAVSLGVPFGAYPADVSLLRRGSWDGESYTLKGAADVGGGLAYPPGNRLLSPYRVPRMQAEPAKGNFASFASHFEAHPEQRFVSDGDPDTVTIPEESRVYMDAEEIKRSGKAWREY
ncbi:MAG: polysaccharide deacetylase family protein [Actinomycetota bacterium]|nr:polysaccharide deacetylase family protein [Actinomycetota bacterium]